MDIQVHEANRSPEDLKAKKPLRHIIIKLLKIKDKERILKTARGKKPVTYRETPVRL